jgi:hypothetical protein
MARGYQRGNQKPYIEEEEEGSGLFVVCSSSSSMYGF